MGKELQLLMEGFDTSFVPRVLAVKQGKKVCFLKGKPDQLTESLAGDCELVESVDSLELVERQNGTRVVKNGNWFFEGVFQRSDVKNANGRTYPRKIWERYVADESSDVQKSVKGRAMTGHNEHPQDGRSDINKLSIVTTNLKLKEDGIVYGRGEILNTEPGLVLQELSMRNIPWGVSSRGRGNVNSEGVVEADTFALNTFDAVHSPSTPGAFPKAFQQQTDDGAAGKNESVTDPSDEQVKTYVTEVEGMLARVDEADTDLILKLISRYGNPPSAAPAKPLHAEVERVRNAVVDKLAAQIGERQAELISESATSDEAASRIAALVQDVETQQRLVDVANTEIARSKRVIESLTAKVDKLSQQVAEGDKATVALQSLNEETSKLRKQLAAAQAALADRTATRVESAVQTTLRGHIKKNPALAVHESLLARCSTLRELEESVKALTQPPASNEGLSGAAMRLVPQGAAVANLQLSESQVDESTDTTPHRGADVASRMIHRQKQAN